MEIKRGIAVSAGVAIGPALVLDTESFRIPQRFVESKQLEEERRRLHEALAAAARDARGNQQAVTEKVGPQYGAIFAAHAHLIEDPTLAGEIEALIVKEGFAAEYAVSRIMRRHAKALESIDSGHLATRAVDLFDIEKAILRNLLGQRREQLQQLLEPVIVLAHDLTPSETAVLDPRKVFAFATEAGGRASHTAIMAGALEIPAVVGLGRFLTDVSGGDLVIVDGNRGIVILNPDEETQERYEHMRSSLLSFESQLGELRDLPAETRDGERIALLGNIEFPHEAVHCEERGADGVGLYRTEFLYLGRQSDPSEAEHLDIVQRKTACLFSVCMRLGAILGGATAEQEDQVGRYGRDLGMAFQIVDDVLDLTASENVLGKPVASDLREGKVTMAVIHALEHCTAEERGMIETVVEQRAFNGVTHAQILSILNAYGSLDAATTHAMQYAESARKAICTFPDSEIKRALLWAPEFVVAREK